MPGPKIPQNTFKDRKIVITMQEVMLLWEKLQPLQKKKKTLIANSMQEFVKEVKLFAQIGNFTEQNAFSTESHNRAEGRCSAAIHGYLAECTSFTESQNLAEGRCSAGKRNFPEPLTEQRSYSVNLVEHTFSQQIS